MKYKRQGDVEALHAKFSYTIGSGGQKLTTKGLMIMDISVIPDLAYRSIVLELEGGPGAPPIATEAFVLEQRTSENTATLCATIGASKRVVKPGKEVAFAIVVANEGLAALPGGRARMDVTITGGTLVEDFVLLERAAPRSANFDPTQLNVEFASLGPGKGQQHALAETFFLVQPDPGAPLISVTATVFDHPTPNDPPFILQAPSVRRVCVPIVE